MAHVPRGLANDGKELTWLFVVQASVQSLSRILSSANPAWDYRVEPFRLPPSTRLMLADVDAGSDTPSLVGKVLKWRKEKPDHGQDSRSL